MQHRHLAFDTDFRVLFSAGGAQAAEMVIAPGDEEGGADNRHRGAAQWLFVVDGHGRADVEGQAIDLAPGSLLLIERGERHRVRNTGSTPLRTLNLYVPPAWHADGSPLPAGEG